MSDVTVSASSRSLRKERDSNLELFRIILMLLIIAHHYVVNSGLLSYLDFQNITGNTLFMQMFAMFGKGAINAFTLITGYFMVKSRVTVLRFLKTYLEVKFYELFFYLVFLLVGFEPFSVRGLFTTVFGVAYWAGHYYTGTYVVLFLLIPLLNLLVKNLNRKQYQYLLAVLLGFFTGVSTFLMHNNFSFVGWLVTVYFLGGYMALYPNKIFNSAKIGAIGTVISVALMAASILVVDFIGVRFGFTRYDYAYSDANKILALSFAFFSFILFKNLKMKNRKWINLIASSSFGVLLFHTNTDAMRRFFVANGFSEYGVSRFRLFNSSRSWYGSSDLCGRVPF